MEPEYTTSYIAGCTLQSRWLRGFPCLSTASQSEQWAGSYESVSAFLQNWEHMLDKQQEDAFTACWKLWAVQGAEMPWGHCAQTS